MGSLTGILGIVLGTLLFPQGNDQNPTAPFNYVPAKAFHVLPGTHNNESGYFSLSEGLDGNLHIGTAAYGSNAYLVEFDPRYETQRVVLDTNKVCGLTATGYAAQSKIHTRNFVGPSGTVYVGSKQGYRLDENDTADYPGGYVMSYDPRNGRTRNLGMPLTGQGVADVTVDESRGLVYVVSCEEQHWMLGQLAEEPTYRELGPLLTPYAMTLVAADGRAYALTHDFQLAIYDPDQDHASIRPITVDGKQWTRPNESSIPTWVLTSDKKRAYLTLMNDPTLLEIDLVGDAPAINYGKMIEGTNPDCRCGLDLGADGNVYAVFRIDNETGFGTGYLHHLVRFQTQAKQMEDLGVLAVSNPDYFDWDATGADAQPPKFAHGFHRLPDDTLTPLHAHMSLKVTHDNTIYITVLYPFTMLQIDQYRMDVPATASATYLEWAEQTTADVEQKLPKITETAELIAQRHLQGGLIGFPFPQQAVAQDLHGRSGGMVHIGFDRPWKKERSAVEQSQDVALFSYEAAPLAEDLDQLRQLKDRGVLLVGFGPEAMPELQQSIDISDIWFDTGTDWQEPSAASADQPRGDALLINVLHSTTLIAEVVAALTRHGQMPTMWKSYSYDDGREWGDQYFGKHQFHPDLQIPPVAAGELGRRYLTQIRYPIREIARQENKLQQAARWLDEARGTQDVIPVAWQGHMPLSYVGKCGDDKWAQAVEFHPFLPTQVEAYRAATPDGARVLSLGYHGLDPIQAAVWQQEQQQVIHLCGSHPDPAWQPGPELVEHIDLGFAFGDACVSLKGYPLCLFAPSGVAQWVAYQAILRELNNLDD